MPGRKVRKRDNRIRRRRERWAVAVGVIVRYIDLI
jgi:hypothetical protein